jgi:aspartyl-tRNA synthetase
MSFVAPEDVQEVMERMLARVWRELLDVEISVPFQRITYDDAMARFGLDAPDLRYGLELKDVSDLVAGSGFKVFADTVAAGGVVKGIHLEETGDWSRKQLDDLSAVVQVYGAKGLAWLKVKEDGSWQSPVAKFFNDEQRAAIGERLGLGPGSVAVFVADTLAVTHAALGNLRKHIARERNLIPEEEFRFCWVTDFPLLEWDEETQRYYAAHHPFTSPRPEDLERLTTDPGAVKAQAYDCVLNGVEIGGGSIRIHDSEVQSAVFEALGIDTEEAQAKFGFLLEALQYGAPPHGGIAMGADRILMLLCGTESIRDVIAFPKTQRQTDLMLDAPAAVDPAQLAELGIGLTPREP